MAVLTVNDLLTIKNMAACGSALKLFIELYDKSGSLVSRNNILGGDTEKLRQVINDTILSVSLSPIGGAADEFRLVFRNIASDIELSRIRLGFEHASQPVRTLNISYSVVCREDDSVILSGQVFFDSMELIWNDAGGCFDISTVCSGTESTASGNAAERLTKEDIGAMIDADLKILSCYNRTEEIKQLTEQFVQLKADESRWTAGELFDMEKRIAAVVLAVVADIRQYREKLRTM